VRRVLVTGVGGPAGVNFVRSLRAAADDYYIVGTDTNRHHLEWPDVDAAYVAPRCDDPAYPEFLCELVVREGIEFVHPQPDPEVRAVSELRDRIPARVFLPDRETVHICQDKRRSGELWQRAGVHTAPSLAVRDRADLERAAETLGLPFWLRASGGAGGLAATPVAAVEAGWHWLRYWQLTRPGLEFVAQELLPGANFAFTSLWRDGELVCAQLRERLEYIYPHLTPSGVTGTPAVAVTRDRPDVEEIALCAVRAIDRRANGVFCVDLKEDADGVARPTEINCGRFFTTSYFFTAAGLNIPDLYVRLGFGEDPRPGEIGRLREGLLWIRHIDCPAVLADEHELASTGYPGARVDGPASRLSAERVSPAVGDDTGPPAQAAAPVAGGAGA